MSSLTVNTNSYTTSSKRSPINAVRKRLVSPREREKQYRDTVSQAYQKLQQAILLNDPPFPYFIPRDWIILPIFQVKIPTLPSMPQLGHLPAKLPAHFQPISHQKWNRSEILNQALVRMIPLHQRLFGYQKWKQMGEVALLKRLLQTELTAKEEPLSRITPLMQLQSRYHNTPFETRNATLTAEWLLLEHSDKHAALIERIRTHPHFKTWIQQV